MEKRLKDHIVTLINAWLRQPYFYAIVESELGDQLDGAVHTQDEHSRRMDEIRRLIAEARRLEEHLADRPETQDASGDETPFDRQRQHAITDVNRRLLDAWYGHPFVDR